MEHHPLITTPPRAQILFSVFSLISVFSIRQFELLVHPAFSLTETFGFDI